MHYHSGIDIRLGLIAFAVLVTTGLAIGQFPGGVGEPIVWIHAIESDGDAQTSVRSNGNLNIDVPDHMSAKELLNYHPMWNAQAMSAQVDPALASESTYFVVYEFAEDAGDRNIWSLGRADTTRMIMTSQRFVDLDKGVYSNLGQTEQQGQLRSYTHHRNQPANGDWSLHLFGAPMTNELPVAAADMAVAEIIIYDRALSEKERNQVESYLALKYGLTIQHPVRSVYLDSRGEVIWSDDDAGEFIHRVTAIGRDDASGLNNRQSKSAAFDNPVSIALHRHVDFNAKNTNVLEDGQYIIWADNGGPLQLTESFEAYPSLKRIWRIDNLAQRDRLTEVLLETRLLAIPEHDGFWWLRIQRGEGLPELYQGEGVERDLVRFDSIRWGVAGSGMDEFTFLPGGEIMPSMKITPPGCGDAADGEIWIKGVGGIAPYVYTVQLDGQLVSTSRSSSDVILSDLKSGVYSVSIEDQTGLRWTEKVAISSIGGQQYCVPGRFSMPKDGPLTLNPADLCAGPGTRISLKNSETVSGDGQVSIAEPGEYFIQIEEEECISIHRIEVVSKDASIFEHISVFPNPVRAGDEVTYRIVLKESRPVTLALFDPSGRMILNRGLGTGQVINGSIASPIMPGAYTLHLRAENDISSTQIITLD